MSRDVLISLSNGGGQPNLSQDDLKRLRIPAPSIAEQKLISEYLDKEQAKYHVIENGLIESISKLKEYRNTLITSAVTGQIDVRKEVA
jgi:type I restriction enzyme, S subunit